MTCSKGDDISLCDLKLDGKNTYPLLLTRDDTESSL